MRSIFHIFLCVLLYVDSSVAEGVSLSQDGRFFRMSNGVLSTTIEKRTGRVTSAKLGGRDLLGEGSGYWSMSASSANSRIEGFGHSTKQFVSIDPATNDGERAEVVCHFHGSGLDGAYPGPAEIRYAVDRHSNTLYATAILSHGVGDAPFRMGEGRFVMKMDGGIFNHLTIDQDRNQVMPSGRDWGAGTPLNMKEVRRMTTGIRKGWAEHKYSYSAMLGKVPAYGWVGTKEPFGVWLINPSVEYIAGGPTKMELTAHLDVGGVGLPTILNMWHGSHYGGTSLSLERDEVWSKVIGPFAIHFNQGGKPDTLMEAAYQHAFRERAAWPYAWVQDELYPSAALRGGISGTLLIDEKSSVLPMEGERWVGLTVPDYKPKERWGSGLIGWQRDGKNYQYWVKANSEGAFSLTGVRPGNYVLRAFADGVLGEFEIPDLTVKSGVTLTLGELRWKPERAGPTLWEIGIPDRSAAEFRNGDRYWHWGNYLKFREDFPKGVNYHVGKSDWKKDWNLCQPLSLAADGKVLGDSKWKVRFPLQQIPGQGARLRVSFCGSRGGADLLLFVNGSEIGDVELPENGVMHRDSHRGMWFERAFGIPADVLQLGDNVLELRLRGNSWHQGVLYDYIRMESVESPQNPKG